jgi:hypothetical protein
MKSNSLTGKKPFLCWELGLCPRPLAPRLEFYSVLTDTSVHRASTGEALTKIDKCQLSRSVCVVV